MRNADAKVQRKDKIKNCVLLAPSSGVLPASKKNQNCLVALCCALLYLHVCSLYKLFSLICNPNLSLYHSPITNKFFLHPNLCPTLVHLHYLSILTSQIRCNLFSSVVLSWQGGRGWSIQPRGGVLPWTDNQTDRPHGRVRSRVTPCKQQGATKKNKNKHIYFLWQQNNV